LLLPPEAIAALTTALKAAGMRCVVTLEDQAP
jgi:hypothetical protein